MADPLTHQHNPGGPRLSGTTDRDVRRPWQEALALALWMGLALAIGIYVGAGGRRTVTPTYRIAADAWFAGRDLYNLGGDIGGFLYFPQAALVFAPFAALPPKAGDVLWRLCAIALFASGVRRTANLVLPAGRAWLFLLFTLLCLPATLSSARNGQMNLHVAGFMLHATADLANGVWWRASLSLALALALKQFAAVPILLTAAVYARTRAWLVAMMATVAVTPFLFQDPGYVAGQYAACFQRLVTASVPDTNTWSDLRGLLLRLGVHVSNERLLFLRLAAAAPTLALAFAARRHGRLWSPVYVYALSASYLMLFNPRTEANSYVILAPAVAAAASLKWFQGRRRVFWTLVVFAVVLGCENYGATVHPMTDLWLKPLLTIGFFVYLAVLIAAGRSGDLESGVDLTPRDRAQPLSPRDAAEPLAISVSIFATVRFNGVLTPRGPRYCWR